MNLTVRSAGPDDEAAVVQLWQTCGLVAPHNDPVADFRFARLGPASDVLVGTDHESRIVGSVMVGHDGHRGWLYYVAVDPAVRQQGIGTQMVKASESWLRKLGVRKVQLMVRETNTEVVRFYERIGYEDMPRVLMSKWLAD